MPVHRPSSTAAGRRRIASFVILTLAVLSAAVITASPAAAATPGTISSAGPLSTITISPDLNCDVRYVSDTSAEFYGNTACGTLVAVGGILYGPASIPAGGSANPRTAYTPVSQVGPTGAGSAADPFRIVTVVDLGTSGLRLTETDTYVAGQENYSTTVSIQNRGSSAVQPVVYRAGDCYLANSDFGLGRVTGTSVACVSTSNRVEQWIPLTPGSHYYEAGYSQVWGWIGAQQEFPDTCRCSENIDNGAGLSWRLSIAAGATGRVSHLTAFSPIREQADRDGDGLLDVWETGGLDVNGDGTVDVDLPAMGASPTHKDLFIEVDWMVRDPTCIWFICWGGRSFAPDQSALADVRAAMAASPVTNPDGSTGVRLHADAGPGSVMNPVTGALWGSRSRANRVAHTRDLGSFSGNDYNWTAFNALKSTNFDPNRRDVFHYALYADRYAGSGSSGIAQVTSGRFAADSFLVTDGDPGWGDGFSRRQESGTFMHEFGHALGLRHGGGDDGNFKPNYQSIQSYFWQLGGRPLDYSRAALPSLNENALSESAGVPGAVGAVGWICPGTTNRRTSATTTNLDFNCDGAVNAGTIRASVNGDAAVQTLTGFNDWPNLVYDGGAVGAFGADDLQDQDPPPTLTRADEQPASAFRARQSFGQSGDGTVRPVGPTVLYADVADQTIHLDVTNVGPTAASYLLRLSGVGGVPGTTTVTVPANAVRRVEVPVNSTGLQPGRLTLTAVLSAPGSTESLSRDTLDIQVPDLSDRAVFDGAVDALDRLADPQPGLDEAVRSDLIAATATALDRADAPARISISPTTATTTAGTPAAFTVTAYDADNQSLGTVTDQATFSAPAAVACTAGSCRATVAGSYQITATYQGREAVATLVVRAAAPATIAITGGDRQSAAPGQILASPLSVKVLDRYGNGVSGAPVAFAVETGSLAFPGGTRTVSLFSDATGRAQAPTVTAGSPAGPAVVVARSGTATPAVFAETVAVLGNGPSDLAVTINAPSSGKISATVPVTVTVQNRGSAPASSVSTVLVLPPELTTTSSGGGTVRSPLVTWSQPTLAPGATVTYTVQVKVSSSARDTLRLVTTVGSAVRESGYANNSVSADIRVVRT